MMTLDYMDVQKGIGLPSEKYNISTLHAMGKTLHKLSNLPD